MLLFLWVTALTLTLAFFVNSRGEVQLHTVPGSRRTHPLWTRGRALNAALCLAVYLVLTALSACRIASGNDYWEYTSMFSLIAQGRHVSSEPGFNCFVLLMQALFGREKYLPIFGVISAATVFFFLRAIYEQSEWFAGALFLFLTGGYYFSSFNSVRYYLVLGICLYSMKYVIRGEYGKFLLCALAASAFHKSALVVIPLYLGAKLLASVRWRPWHFAALGVLALSLVFGKDLYRQVIFFFYPFYENSAFDRVDYSLANIAKCLGTLFLSALCYRSSLKGSVRLRFYCILNLGGLLLYTFGAFIPEVSRVAYYLVASQILLIPGLLSGMEKGWRRSLLTAGTALAFAGYFALFLRTAYDTDIRLLPYLNWIFN